MPTESITKEFVINDDATLDILLQVISEHKAGRKGILPGRYEEGKRLLQELFPSHPEPPENTCKVACECHEESSC